ncbi:MAG: ribokinase [Clostridia bacterium]|jgi:ribokinase|nr:ribokinase [Clostridia bacterium]
MNSKITVFGSFVVDLMGRSPHLPVPGETVKGSIFKMGAGGKGFNQAVAAHKAGADVTMITKLGRDTFANVALDTMKELGMDTGHLFYNETEGTGIALIIVDENTSQNEIVVVSGSCNTITKEDIKTVEDVIKASKYVLLQFEVNADANERVINFAHENGVKVVLNTAPVQPIEDSLLAKVDIVTPNEVEAEALTGICVDSLEAAKKAAKVFFDKGVKEVVITLGSRGVFISSNGREEIVPSFKVDAIDTTGAGDAFNGGFLAALAEGKDVWEAARFASALAALSVQRLGTTPAMPTREEIDQFLKEHSA